MSEISRFFGISVHMYHNEHGPPHFHALYGEYSVSIRCADGSLRGHIPPRAARLLREWYDLHRQELLDNWSRAVLGLDLQPIEPLE